MTPDATFDETSEIRKEHVFDLSKLENYMRENIEGFKGKIAVRQFIHGQSNPTFIISDSNKKYILRKKPPGKLLPSAHAIERECRIISALQHTGVPLPRIYSLCEDDKIIGTSFFIMEHVEGRIFRDASLAKVTSSSERKAIYESAVRTLANLHAVDWQGAGLSDYGKTGNYIARQVKTWSKQYLASKTDDIKSMDALMEWLPENIPDDDTTTIAHGDFRMENLIIHPTEPRVIAVLDWELSTLGHPLADLGYNSMKYHVLHSDYKTFGIKGLDHEAMGIPSESDYLNIYCEEVGRKHIPAWEYFVAFSMFRLAAIVQGVYKRGLDGNASSPNAREFGKMVPYMANIAWEIVR